MLKCASRNQCIPGPSITIRPHGKNHSLFRKRTAGTRTRLVVAPSTRMPSEEVVLIMRGCCVRIVESYHYQDETAMQEDRKNINGGFHKWGYPHSWMVYN